MLILIGLGLSDENDMNLRGIIAAKKADKVYFELYTGKWNGYMEKLKEIIEHDNIIPIKRIDLEENSQKILNEAKNKKIAILIQGDPMVATTHSSLLVDAKKMGIHTSIIHNSSIFSAISETGLHIYKFGATITIPFLDKTGGILPKSIYDSIRENKKIGLHTLCLLDIGNDTTHLMTPNHAIDFLLKLENKFNENVIENSQKIIILSRAGQSSQLFFDNIELLQKQTINTTPSVLIIPSKLHFTEKDYLEIFKE